MPDFYDSQNKEIKMIITAIFKEFTDLEEFARIIMSIKASLNNPDVFDKWMENEEIEFKEPPIQEDTKKVSTSQSSNYHIFGIDKVKKSFEIYDLDTRQLSRGPDPPEWRSDASVGYSEGKLYYLGGWDPKTEKNTNRIDLLMDGEVKRYIDYPMTNGNRLKSESFQKNGVLSELHR
ncbi:hypothetical protein WR25_19134 [Diploscapter pachys]|uniref:Uncharacterized protein n=1 Tax=Diploscapter pachys TaxID=2018661 RepID=A0A2A2LJH7_9BILA|nr:hypothetical protein WR25_19134 [Diploscapter pachys]